MKNTHFLAACITLCASVAAAETAQTVTIDVPNQGSVSQAEGLAAWGLSLIHI